MVGKIKNNQNSAIASSSGANSARRGSTLMNNSNVHPRDEGLKTLGNLGVIVDTMTRGHFFGEKALQSDQKRGATIFLNEDCEFLVITKDVFDDIRKNYDKTKNKALNFIKQTFPNIEFITSRKVLENLYYIMDEKIYEKGSPIIEEGVSDEKFYLIYDGECEIYKNIEIDQAREFKAPVSDITDLVRVRTK